MTARTMQWMAPLLGGTKRKMAWVLPPNQAALQAFPDSGPATFRVVAGPEGREGPPGPGADWNITDW